MRAAPFYDPAPRRVIGDVGLSAARSLRFLEESVLREHADPARRVAGDDESVVVDARVGVRPVVAQHGVDHAQELVGGGEDGSLVAQAGGQRPMIAVELRPGGPRSRVGALGQRSPQRRVSRACASRAALAGAGVVARRHTCPRAQVARLAEGPQVRSDLNQDGAGAAEIDSRNRLQQPQGALVVGQCGLDAGVQCGKGGVGTVDGLHLHL